MGRNRQRQFGTVILVANGSLILMALYMSLYDVAIAWLLGLSFGFVFQRSRFCVVGAIRDVFLLQNFTIAKNVLLYLALSTSIFGFLFTISLHTPLTIASKLEAVGILTVIGAFVFGIGMVIAGGCAASTLIRMGEGMIMQWWAFLGLILGLLTGAWTYPMYKPYNYGFTKIFLPDYLGISGAVIVQLLIVASIYLVFRWVEQKNEYDINYMNATTSSQETTKKLQERIDLAGYTDRILRPWPYKWGAISLAILTSLVFLWNQIWGIARGLMHLSLGLTNLYIGDVSQWHILASANPENILLRNPLVPLVIAMVIGSFMASLLAKEFRIRQVAHKRFIGSALIGGFLMGIGARLASGCNVSAVMSGIPSLSLHGWVFLLFMTLGVLVGIRMVTRYLVV